jgi:hypothetical protein
VSNDHYRRRISRIEDALAKVSPATSTIDERVAALKSSAATPSQMEHLWSLAGDDIGAQVVRLAWYCRQFYEAGGTFEGGADSAPVTRAIEILSHRADEPLDLSPYFVPPYDPEAWRDPVAARGNKRYVPHGFKAWARTYLMTRLLGNDGGLALRHQIDEWLEGGDPPVDVDRYPHESVYQLVLPIDGDTRPMFDARMLRLPTADLHERIETFPNFDVPECWDTPEGRHLWTPVDNTGFEWF